jgi:hypothetical protein
LIMRSFLEWAIRHHVSTAFAAALLLIESMLLHADAFRIGFAVWGFLLVLGTYNAYRLLFQRLNLRSISFHKWPLRFRVRFLLTLISFGYVTCYFLQNNMNSSLYGVLALLFFLYAMNRMIEAPSLWLDLLGWIKAPMLALVWFCITFYWSRFELASVSENMIVWGVNRFGLFLLVAMSNDVHDREKDAERGLITWPVRFSKMQIQYLGAFIASCMIAVSIIHVGKNDGVLLTETGVFHGFLGFACLWLSYNRHQYYKHILMMDGILILGSFVVLFANYLRNLPI